MMILGSVAGLAVIASEAKQSSFILQPRGLDCFVALLLAMTIQPNLIALWAAGAGILTKPSLLQVTPAARFCG